VVNSAAKLERRLGGVIQLCKTKDEDGNVLVYGLLEDIVVTEEATKTNSFSALVLDGMLLLHLRDLPHLYLCAPLIPPSLFSYVRLSFIIFTIFTGIAICWLSFSHHLPSHPLSHSHSMPQTNINISSQL
jgi:hypothetical protein